MSTLKVSKVEPVTSGGDCIVNATNIVGNKNLIMNGAMEVAQRGTSSTTSGYGTVDRWKHQHGGADEAPTYAQVSLTSSDTGPWAKGFRKAFQITNGNQTGGADAGDYVQVWQGFEAQDLASSGWDYTSNTSYITLSFWVKSSVAQSFFGAFRTADGTSQNYHFQTGSLSANTWTKITKKIPGASGLQFDQNSDVGLYMYLFPFLGTDLTSSISEDTWMAATSTNYTADNTSTWYTTNDATFAVTGVQLEVGDVATAFEHRMYHDYLKQCQRYYWQTPTDWCFYSVQYNGDNRMVTIMHPEEMRGIPTVALTGGTITSWTGSGNSGQTNRYYQGYDGLDYNSNSTTIVTSAKFDAEY
jgi:hypothetical protein